ncbi:hypothetical protein DMB95_06880 [Campylobacter sp. MIT 12-8780]|uniref:hypothetical protein n=1 Tax=unclassified Campylobacter TaxID=2593542 RepID=UPI00115E901E|nr:MULTISPECIES: hypothetical protein [unclassified Campylobacter]NDJ27686.1 hypothetical protein [Campylobacter sp. MIT 19-121]TQR40850.1 hypothetical protein DMB95_06880 [Campylobacter sp. MIT 12-8780]
MFKFEDMVEDKVSDLHLVKFFIKQLYLYSQANNEKEEIEILFNMLFALPLNKEDMYSVKSIQLKDKEEELLVLLEHIYMIPNVLSQRKFIALVFNLLMARGYDFDHLISLLHKKG